MKIRINGKEYPAVSVENAQLIHLMELQAQGPDLVPGGLGMGALQRMERETKAYHRSLVMAAAQRDAGQDSIDPDMPDCCLTLMAVTVFLTRRAAGDVVSLRQALEIRFQDIEEVPEPTDMPPSEEELDPTKPVNDGQGTPAVAAPAVVN